MESPEVDIYVFVQKLSGGAEIRKEELCFGIENLELIWETRSVQSVLCLASG